MLFAFEECHRIEMTNTFSFSLLSVLLLIIVKASASVNLFIMQQIGALAVASADRITEIMFPKDSCRNDDDCKYQATRDVTATR